MKKSFVLWGLLFFVTLYGANNGPAGNSCQPAVINSFQSALDPEDGVYPETEPRVVPSQGDVELGTTPSHYAPLWADDKLVTDQCNILFRYKIALDYDVDGNIYAAVQSSFSTDADSLYIFKSTDRGYTWSQIFLTWAGTGGDLRDFEFRIEPYKSDPLMYLVWVDTVTAGCRFYFGAIEQNGTEHWYEFSDSIFTDVVEAAMDVSPEADPTIAISYIRNESPGETGWYTLLSSDSGITWASWGPHTASSGPRDVTTTAQDSTHFYSGVIYTQSSNRFRMYRHYDGGWGFQNVSTTIDTTRQSPILATQKHHTYPNNYVYGMYTIGTGVDERVFFSYSSDGGQNFNPEYWSLTGEVESEEPHIRIGWDQTNDRPVACCNVEGGAFDTLVAGMTETDFHSWYLRATPNDYSLTGDMPAQITYATVTGLQGRILIYREFASDNIWFDRWNMYNSVEEEPVTGTVNGFNLINQSDRVSIRFSLPADQNVKIAIYDLSGRIVNSLVNGSFSAGEHQIYWNLKDNSGEQVQGGNYFIRFDADNNTTTKTIQVF